MVGNFPGMTFAPRFSPDGQRVIMSLQQGGNSNIFVMDLRSKADDAADRHAGDRHRRRPIRPTARRSASRPTAAARSRSTSCRRRAARRSASASAKAVIRRRCGRRAATSSPSPSRRGGKFAIGIMKPDGSGERILTAGFHNEGPTLAPNGRVLMFFRDLGGKRAVAFYDRHHRPQRAAGSDAELRVRSGVVAAVVIIRHSGDDRNALPRRLMPAAFTPINHTERLTGDRSRLAVRGKAPSRLMERSFNEAAATCLNAHYSRRLHYERSLRMRTRMEEGDDRVQNTASRRALRGRSRRSAGDFSLRQRAARTMPRRMRAGAATPGSQQDFVVNVGDRVFFETELDRSDAAGARDARQAGAVAAASTAISPSRSKATPTSAARANTTSRSAPAAPRPCATISSARGVSASRMRTISYGKERPVAVCNDISCWSQNRRAVTVLGATS